MRICFCSSPVESQIHDRILKSVVQTRCSLDNRVSESRPGMGILERVSRKAWRCWVPGIQEPKRKGREIP